MNHQYTQGKDLQATWLQTTDEVHLQIPTERDIRKSDLHFQVHPRRLKLTVKDKVMLEGDLPEAIDIDGMADTVRQ